MNIPAPYRHRLSLLLLTSLLWLSALGALLIPAMAASETLVVPMGRSELVVVPAEMAEVMIANPDVADVHVHGATRVSVIGKQIGRTNLRIFDADNHTLKAFDVMVGHDLTAIRQALKEFMPNERIGVELVNTNIALVGNVSSASAVDRAMQIVQQFVKEDGGNVATGGTGAATSTSKILNLLQVTSGQQVMLRVRVGEIQRSALKEIGVSLNGAKLRGGAAFGGGTNAITTATAPGGPITLGGAASAIGDTSFGFFTGALLGDTFNLSATLEALETDGVLKILAEPNLAALSGEKAEFLAGGEFPVPISQGDSDSVSVEFKPFGVAVQFIPYVLSDNRIRLAVEPEVSEISEVDVVEINGSVVPSITTRRAKTTVELAPGESFMIAGLLRDQLNSTIRQIPGLSEIPILSALLRSSAYQRNETELVIAVTPYLVDPVKSGDIRLPTDHFRPASSMEMLFYGALGSLEGGDTLRASQTPALEGPIGFMVD